MWPSENPWPIIICLLVAAVATAILWYQQQRPRYLLAILVMLLLAAGAWGYDQTVVTDREQVAANVLGVAKAFQERRIEDTYGYVSNSARDIRLIFGTAYNLIVVHDDMRVTDMSVEMLARDTRAKARFRVNATVTVQNATQHVATLWEAKWQRESEGWKMIDLAEFDPVSGERKYQLEQVRGLVGRLYPPPQSDSAP